MTHRESNVAARLTKDFGIMAVAIGGRIFPGKRPDASAEAFARAATKMVEALPPPSGLHAQIETDSRFGELRCHTLRMAGMPTLAVVIRMGHPITKSLRRMIRRAVAAEYGKQPLQPDPDTGRVTVEKSAEEQAADVLEAPMSALDVCKTAYRENFHE